VGGVQTNLRYSTIYAPFDGTIGISQVKVGTAVSPGQMILNTVSSDNPMAVDFNIDEKEINRFVQLQQKGTHAKDSIFTIVLPDATIYPYTGQIALLDRAIDPTTGTIKARLVFQNKNNVLRSGMSCNVRVKNNGSMPQILIPYKAVTEQMGEYFVYVLGDSSKVNQRKITLGQRIHENIIVKEGLQPDEKIVTEGVQKVKDGAVVQVSR
jgi:membrane fusion protein (multidrug efflux system)